MRKTAQDDAIELLLSHGWKEVGVSVPRKFVLNDQRATVGTRSVNFWRQEGDAKRGLITLLSGQQAAILAQILERRGKDK